jgi:cytokinin riboside 5'-monophosphate phosphoribohydrolase
MINNICVFTSSSDALDKVYYSEAEELAGIFVKESFRLIYGGAKVGMMGRMAKLISQNGGKVTGVIPELIFNNNLAESSIELIVTEDMKSRKAKMAELSDAFIALPGGFGTLEELAEVITLKQLEYHHKPIAVVNTAGFYDKLLEFFEVFYSNNFAKSDYKALYYIANNPKEAIDYIKSYKPAKLVSKWYKANLNV